ncbi:MAG: hypothetical protein AAGD43_25745 [Pseudomonadota bacterium]
MEPSNKERLARIPADVAAIIGDAEFGDPDRVQDKIDDLTALLAQLAASYAAVITTIGMHRQPAIALTREAAVKQLDKEIALQIDLWMRMSKPGSA